MTARAPLAAAGGALGGWVAGDGLPVLLLHGGPGLSYEYLEASPTRSARDYRIAAYQQRGLEPSTVEGPFDIAPPWPTSPPSSTRSAGSAPGSSGTRGAGTCSCTCATAAPWRLHGGLAIDPLGAVGDGGMAAFEAEMVSRTPEGDRGRAQELDERAMRGEGTPEDSVESMRLFWPAYFASPDRVIPFPPVQASVEAYSGLLEAAQASMPELARALADVGVPFGCVAGARSPMPCDQAAEATVRAIPGAWLEVIDGAGHFPWFERPGCVRNALRRLAG